MAYKNVYVDGRVKVTNTDSEIAIQNRINLTDTIQKVVELSDGFDSVKIDSITETTANAGVTVEGVAFEDNIISGAYVPVIAVTAATKDLELTDSGSTVVLARATGAAVTLPTATAGATFKFVTLTNLTSGSYTITAEAGDFLVGGILAVDDATPEVATMFKPDGSTNLIITFNGTTTGGETGTEITVTALNASSWMVTGIVAANGVLATPFS